MVDKNLMNVDQAVQVDDSDMMYAVKSETTDARVSVNQLKVYVRNGLTKNDVGLSNVDNTPDVDKPISTLTQNALNLKQDTLVSGATIKTLNGQSVLGAGNIDVGAAIESTYTVVTRNGSLANQVHSFGINNQTSFGFDAFALREETGLTNQTVVRETFDAGSSVNYDQTGGLVWNGVVEPVVGESGTTTLTGGGFFELPIRTDSDRTEISSEYILAYYPFDSDSSPSSGSISGVPTNVTFTSTSPSGIGGSAVFNGTNAKILFNGLGSAMPKQNFTISIWFYHDGAAQPTQFARVFDAWDNNGATLYFQNSTNLTLQLSGSGGSNEQMVISNWTSTNPSGWYHFCIVHTPTLAQLYINGVISGSFIPGASVSFTNDLVVGADVVQSVQYLRGNLDYFYILNKPLTQAEVTLMYQEYEVLEQKLLLRDGETYYSVTSGVLQQVQPPTSSNDFDVFGFEFSGSIPATELVGLSSLFAVSSNPTAVTVRYTPFSQIAIQKSLTSLSAYSRINSATVTATQTADGKVRLAVSRDLIDWFSWDGTSWAALGTLTNDTTSAEAVITNGMSPATVGGLTFSQWELLFPGEKPDKIAFAYALDVPNPLTDVASIDTVSLNVNFNSAWLQQSPTQVEIRLYNETVTFKTVTAGNYKLAYQAPA